MQTHRDVVCADLTTIGAAPNPKEPLDRRGEMLSPGTKRRDGLLTLLLGVCVLWSYWPTLHELVERWTYDAQYSHGYLVPAFSLYLLWRQRRRLAAIPFQPHWSGAGLVLAGLTLRLVGSYFFYPWLDAFSLLPVLAGVAVLLGGWPALRLTWPAVAFLGFMLPLPHSLQNALAHPLQRVATATSAYLLETLGLPAVTKGNIILLRETKVGVVEACNGLSMLVTFLALSTAVALVRRGLVDRAVLLLSAVPIALAANVLRITGTAVLQEKVGGVAAQTFFHDVAGWLMMPLGLALLGLELVILKNLIVEERQAPRGWEPPIGRPAAHAPSAAGTTSAPGARAAGARERAGAVSGSPG